MEKQKIRRQRRTGEKTKQLRISLRGECLQKLNEMEEYLGISRSSYISMLIEEDVMDRELRRQKLSLMDRFK